MAWKVVIACQSLGLEALFPGSESMSQESFLLKSGWEQRLEDGVLEATSSAKELCLPRSPRSGLVSIPYKGKSSLAGRLDANESLTHANEFPIKSAGWELKGSVTKTTDSRGAGKKEQKIPRGSLAS